MASILLMTPDRSFAQHAAQALSQSGHQVVQATDRDESARAALTVPFDIVVADSLAPDLDDLRQQLDASSRLPWIFVAPSSRPIREGDRIVRKPASSDDLRNAVASALGAGKLSEVIDLVGLTFDRPGQRILNGDLAETLTPIEFRLLEYLSSVRGSIARTEDLLEHVWQYSRETSSSDVVRSHMKNLRAKMRRVVSDGKDPIETIPRRGYRLT